MKNSRFAALGVLALNLVVGATAFAEGGINGGGGNGYAVLVAQEGAKLAQDLKRVPLGELHELKPYLFDKAITDTKLEMARELTLNGKPVDAINYPDDQRIEFSMPAVERLKGSKEFTVLVLHEYLGILRISDLNYRVSLPLVDYLESNPAQMSFRGGYDTIECKVFSDGKQIAGEQASAYHGVDLLGDAGADWNAYFTSGIYEGRRRLFFRMEALDAKTHVLLAAKEITAQDRIEATLELGESHKSMYCWVHYLTR